MKRGEVANFIEKLDLILETPQFQDIVHWADDGHSFVIESATKFTDLVLPKFFKHHNYSSFNRQLNMYNFVKIRSETDQIIYQNEYFTRSNKHLYNHIKRRSRYDNDEESKTLISYNEQKAALQQLREIGKRQHKLQDQCKAIFNQNQNILSQNTRLWKKISQKINNKNKQISALLYLLLLKTDNKQLISQLPSTQIYNQHVPDYNSSSDSSEDQRSLQQSTPQNLNNNSKNQLQFQVLKNQYQSQAFQHKKVDQNNQDLTRGLSFNATEEDNLCIKENGQSSKSQSQKQISEKDNTSVVSDMNYLLNDEEYGINGFSDYEI